MAILALHPYNKNQYRKFPFKQGSTLRADNGYALPDDLVVACSITSIYGKHRIYVKQIFRNAAAVKITIASVLTDEVLGAFSGDVAADYTSINLEAYTRNVGGILTLGSKASLDKITSTLNFLNPQDETTTEFEESVIFCYTPPGVSSIRDKQNNETRGFVDFGTLTNVAKFTVSDGSQLTALSPENVFNPADKSSYLGNCSTPAIKNINGVHPYAVNESTESNDGNIFLVGVKPVVFYGDITQRGALKITTPGVTLDSLCTQKHKLLPPVDVSGFTIDTLPYKNMYYSKPALDEDAQASPPRPARLAGNFRSTLRPEYYYWPQFVKEEYYAYWRITVPSVPTIQMLTPIAGGFSVSFTPPLNDGGVSIANYEYSLNGSAQYISLGTTSPASITGLQPLTTYSVRIRAVNALQVAGACSNSLTSTTL